MKAYRAYRCWHYEKRVGIVQFWMGWCEARNGGMTIPPVVARILSGDSTSPLTRDGHGCPKLNAQRLCTDAKPTERSYGKNIVHGKG